MISFVCRIINHVYVKPLLVLRISFLLWVLSLIVVFSTPLNFSTIDLIGDQNSVKKITQEFENQKGSLHEFVIVVQSEQSSQNQLFFKNLEAQILKLPQTERIEWTTEAQFFEKFKLMYIDLIDLEEIQNRVNQKITEFELKNPLVVDIQDSNDLSTIHNASALFVNDFEQKYAKALNPYLGNSNNTLMIMKVYPKSSTRSFLDLKRFYEKLKEIVDKSKKQIDPSLNIQITGEGVQLYRTQGSFQNAVLKAQWITLVLWLILALFYCKRQLGLFVAFAIPLVLNISFCMAILGILFHQINLLVILFGSLIGSISLQSSLYLISRYKEERNKRLSPRLAFSTIALETGPTLFIALLGMALSILPMYFYNIRGVIEFTWAFIFAICFNILSTLIIIPSLLLVLQRNKIDAFKSAKSIQPLYIHQNPFPQFKFFIFLMILGATFFIFTKNKLQHQDNTPPFQFEQSAIDSTLNDLGLIHNDPIIVKIHSPQEKEWIKSELRKYNQTHTQFPVTLIRSAQDLLPQDQQAKQEIIFDLKQKVKKEFVEKLSGEERIAGEKLWEAVQISDTVKLNQLPQSLRKKFELQNQSSAEYIFLFPKNNSIQARMELIGEISSLKYQNEKLDLGGGSILFYQVISLFQEKYIKVLLICPLIWFLWSLITLRKAIPLIISMGLGACIAVIWIQNIAPLSTPFIALLCPLYFGYVGLISLPIYSRNLEEGMGSILYVYQTTGRTALLTLFVGAACFAGFVISEHPQLKLIGYTGMIGFASAVITSHIILPIFLDLRDRILLNSRKEFKE